MHGNHSSSEWRGIVLCLLVFCGSPVIAGEWPESRYDGRTLAEWRVLIGQIDYTAPDRQKFVAGLLQIVEDPRVPWFSRRQAALTLGRLGQPAEAAVPVLTELLTQTEPNAETAPQGWAAKALGLFGPIAADATPALIKLASQPQTSLMARLSALDALSRIGRTHPAAIPAMILLLNPSPEFSDALTLQRAACETLIFVGPDAAPAVPHLLRLTTAQDATLRRLAIEALTAIGPLAAVAAPQVFDGLVTDEDPAVADAAERALASWGTELEPQIFALAEADDTIFRLRATRILASWPSSNTRQAVLKARLNDPDASVQLAAVAGLWQQTQDAAPLVEPLERLLIVPDRQIRRASLRQVELMQVAHRDLLPALKRRLAEQPPHTDALRRAVQVLQEAR